MRRNTVAALLAVTIACLPSAARAQSSSEEAQFAALINQLRTGKGLPALVVDSALAGTSCTWTDHMVATDTLGHDPALASEVGAVETAWTKAGENVGVGGDVTSLFNAFVASPGHYANLVDPSFNRLGLCVSWMPSGTKMYTTHRFVATGAATNPEPPRKTDPPTTHAPKKEPTTAPATTEPTTTTATTAPPTTEPPTTTEAPVPVSELLPLAGDAVAAAIAATSPLLVPVGAVGAIAQSVSQHEKL